MKKIMVMLLSAVVAVNAMAVTYTAKAQVTLTSGSGSSFNLMLSESAEYGALTGSVMYEGEGLPYVALYVINGSDKLQIAKAADLRGAKLGLKTDAKTNYTIDVSSVAGSETLYLYDAEQKKNYALTEGAHYDDIVAVANTTNETRFSLRKLADVLNVCFKNNKIEINENPFDDEIVVKDANGDQIAGSPFAASTPLIDMTSIGAAGDRFTVEFNGGNKKFVVVKE